MRHGANIMLIILTIPLLLLKDPCGIQLRLFGLTILRILPMNMAMLLVLGILMIWKEHVFPISIFWMMFLVNVQRI